jgi:hypothetical protein
MVINHYFDVTGANSRCTIDDDGRFKLLTIIGCEYEPFALPANIARLEKLTELTVWSCRSFPMELSNLQYLRSLQLFDNNFPVQMVLSNLKILNIIDPRIQSSFLEWMTKQLPRLEELIITSVKSKNEIDCILDSLRNTKNLCFQDTLKSLKMSSCNMDQKSFEV